MAGRLSLRSAVAFVIGVGNCFDFFGNFLLALGPGMGAFGCDTAVLDVLPALALLGLSCSRPFFALRASSADCLAARTGFFEVALVSTSACVSCWAVLALTSIAAAEVFCSRVAGALSFSVAACVCEAA